MPHIRTIKKGNLQDLEQRGCLECQVSCQSACKTSCTVGNQFCRQTKEPAPGDRQPHWMPRE